ncbi:spore germination protein [Paenibacillus thalictri]|uniref:Spore germination protein n=1 Tax=Paenibacillus thalictri TaxID=2527873 RepID=A0A4Q9DWM6_9BACL|nr:spore germination protein [Paenibacillus thalictri]TBL80409.1 spore germination protein [Paenibacillus thalictri]
MNACEIPTLRSDAISDWDEGKLNALFRTTHDVKIQGYPYNETPCMILVYCEGMADLKQLNEIVLPHLKPATELADDLEQIVAYLEARMQLYVVKTDQDWSLRLFSGELIMFIGSKVYTYNLENMPKRSPEESASEISLKGPRDGFTEEVSTNISLIRKRLRSTNLQNEQFIIGDESITTVSLLYLQNIASPDLIDEVRERIKNYRTTGLFSSAQFEETLADNPYSIFPLIDYIGRPDYVAQCLLRGRFTILVNGSPMAIMGPSNLTEQLKSPEDLHFPYYFVAFERVLRFIGLFVAIFLPGFWIALTSFNMEQIPFRLLATVTNSRLGLPLSAPLEALLILGLFELFREAGIRLPRAVGQTIAVVGGLIIGDSAIRAGLTSPTMLVTSGVTAVATFILVNQSLSGTVSILRIFTLLLSSILGMFGFFISVMAIVIYLSGLESFGVGYLEPLSPITFNNVPRALLDIPKKWKRQVKPDMFKK